MLITHMLDQKYFLTYVARELFGVQMLSVPVLFQARGVQVSLSTHLTHMGSPSVHIMNLHVCSQTKDGGK